MRLRGIFDPMVGAYFESTYGNSGGGEADHSMEDGLITGVITEYRNDRVESLGRYAFYANTTLTRLTLPNVKTVGGSSISVLSKLKILELGNVTSVGNFFLDQCSALDYLILRAETVSLNINHFSALSSSDAFNMLVPRSLQSEYADAVYDPRGEHVKITVLALEDYTVDGTITGELDESKL